MTKRYLVRHAGQRPFESDYGSVDDILRETIYGQPPERPRLYGDAAKLLIRRMSQPGRTYSDTTVAKELNITDPGRIRRAREWLGLTDVEPPHRATQDEQAAEFRQFVDDDPPEAA